VAAADGFVTKINRVVTFTDSIRIKERAPLRFWITGSSITEFLTRNVGQNVMHDFEENLKTDWVARDMALPILELKIITAKAIQKRIQIAKILLRLPSPAKLSSLALPDKESDRIIFVIDASSYMQPAGRQVLLTTLERLSARGTKWQDNKQVGLVLFGGDGRNKFDLYPPKPFNDARRMLQELTFGGGPPTRPLIDAIDLGLETIRGRQNAQDLVVAFASAETYPSAIGEHPYLARRGMTATELLQKANQRKVNLVLVQATNHPGAALSRILGDIDRSGGVRVMTVRYKPDGMDRLVVSAIDRFLGEDPQVQSADKSKRLLAESISNVGGIPVFPRDLDFNVAIIKIKNLTSPIPKEAEWVNVPVWIIADQEELLKIR
jgi:hypothetical protein